MRENAEMFWKKLAMLQTILNLLDFCKGSMRKLLGKISKETKKIEMSKLQKR